MRIEIELQKLDKTLGGLVRAMGDTDFEGLITHEKISFDSQEPANWFSEERRIAFEEKFNKEVGTEDIFYKVVSVRKVL